MEKFILSLRSYIPHIKLKKKTKFLNERIASKELFFNLKERLLDKFKKFVL